MQREPLPASPLRINPTEANMEKSSIFPSSPLRFETDLPNPREEREKSSKFSPLLLGFHSDSAGPKEESIETSEFSSFFSDQEPVFVGAGLRNIGNTCYLNSVLQCMIHTVPIVEKLLSFDHHHPKYWDDSHFCSLCSLKRLVNSCMTNRGWFETPYEFTENLRKISPDFFLGDQQDAHEFFLCLLDNLHNCCLDSISKGQPSSMEKDSLVNHVYGGRSISQLRCSECGYCSDTPEPFLDLSLEITDANTLVDALKSYTKVEKIDETKFNCDGCKSQVLMEKQTKIEQAPTVISLHLKRFRNDGEFIEKIDKFVQYPLELDLRPFISCPREEHTIYDLYAVLVHRGRAYYGHYYCYVRSSPTTWHAMDDSTVRRLPEPTAVLKEMAYILFYIKQGSSPCFSSLMETQNAKVTSPICDTSPISVLDFTGGALSPSAEETSSSSSRVTPEKEEPGPCPTVSAEPVPAHPVCNHSPSPSHTCDGNSHQQGAHNAMTSRFRAQHAKRPNPDHCVINIDNVFHDEQFEDEKENIPTQQVNIGSKGTKEVSTNSLKPTEHSCGTNVGLKRLMRGMSSSRRSLLLACLPPDDKVSKRSPLISKTHSLNKKRRSVFSDTLPSNAEDSQRQRPIMGASSSKPSSRSLSPSAIRRGLF